MSASQAADPAVSVVLATYNQPRLLDLALHAYTRQSRRDFEIVIADDGSGPETREVIEAHARSAPYRIEHVWQPDEQWRKAIVQNKAALETRGRCLIFSDGDCMPCATFVEQHLRASRPGHYAVGGHIRLSEEYSAALTPEAVRAGVYEGAGTRRERLALWALHLKSLVYIAAGKRRKPKFYGMNFSVDRESFFAVNGFDNNYKNYGKEDSDLRNRLQLAGVRAVSLWHRARVYHLYHPFHTTRLLWPEGPAYYNRPDLEPVAPSGLREALQST